MAIKPDFHHELADLFLNDIQYQRGRYYAVIGKSDVWNEFDEVEPNTTDDSFSDVDTLRANMVFAKKLIPSDASLVCKMFRWESGFTYNKWDNTISMVGLPFYVMNDAYQVFKCLDNSGNQPSTVEPTGDSIYPLRTADGYLWKYMYTVPAFKRTRFLSDTYLPVQRALSDSFYNKGSIEAVIVNELGSGYADQRLTTIQITGTTTGAGATMVITSVGASGEITGVNITNGGSNYTYGAKVNISTSTGQDAVITLTATGGVITGYTITNPGFGYLLTDVLTVVTGGADLMPVVSRTTGEIVKVLVLDGGAGYTAAPTLTAVGTASNPGTGKYNGNTGAVLQAVVENGKIVNVGVVDPGVGYAADNNTTILVQGDGTGAVFSPVVIDGEIREVVVENPGQNYTYLTLTVIGQGDGAIITPVIGQSDLETDQYIIEQTTVPGAIYAIEVVNGGEFYSEITSVTVTGDGTGCTAEPIIEAGVITKILVTNFGKDYTYATVTITDLISGQDAVAYPILSPYGGHGSNAPKELLSDAVALNTSVRGELAKYDIVNDFRQFGILKNPTSVGTNIPFIKLEEPITYRVSFVNPTGLAKDEVLIFGQHRFLVVDIDESEVILQCLHSINITPTGTCYKEGDEFSQFQTTGVVSSPTLNKQSGSLMFVSNENYFSFTADQGVILRTFIKF